MTDEKPSILDALKTGETVSNPVAVTQWGNAAFLVAGVITAVLTILHVFGVSFTLDNDQVSVLASALVSLAFFAKVLLSKLTNPTPALPAAIKPKPPADSSDSAGA